MGSGGNLRHSFRSAALLPGHEAHGLSLEVDAMTVKAAAPLQEGEAGTGDVEAQAIALAAEIEKATLWGGPILPLLRSALRAAHAEGRKRAFEEAARVARAGQEKVFPDHVECGCSDCHWKLSKSALLEKLALVLDGLARRQREAVQPKEVK